MRQVSKLKDDNVILYRAIDADGYIFIWLRKNRDNHSEVVYI